MREENKKIPGIKFVTILILLVLLAMTYTGLKNRTGATSEVAKTDKPQASTSVSKLSVSELMNTLNFQEINTHEKAPDFSLQSLDGKQAGLSQFRGNIVLLSFWATW
jgi:flagellar basal body-associated protein FliL